jgi:magnesium transporter
VGEVPTDLFEIRHDLRRLRRTTNGLRDTLTTLLGDIDTTFGMETKVYLRDCQDHAVRLREDVEGWREFASNLMEIQLALSGQQLNAVMKVLTIIATIFIPLSFIAGVYGMNFDPRVSALNMPELHWPWGYPFALALMALVALGQLYYFRRRGWLGGRGHANGDPR